MEDKNNNNIPDPIEDKLKEYYGNKIERFEFLERRLQEIGTHTSVAIELIVALLVFLACLVGIVNLFPGILEFIESGATGQGLIEFLERVFTLVIGIEFLKMLCKPSSENVLETIIFLIARHMILGEASALEDLFYVLAIALLVTAKVVIVLLRKKHGIKENDI